MEADKNWTPIRVGLSDYAGQEVTLSLEINPLGIPLGDWAYWGNPIVYSQQQDSDAVPVILISIDTLRADHMSVYGYERPTTPKLEAWAKEEAVVFETAMTPESWTLPAHMSMMTGLYPPNHGVNDQRNLDAHIVTLAETLRENGYLTAGYTGHSWWLKGQRGFSHGFDVYDTPTYIMRHIYETDVRVQEWLRTHLPRQQFLFFHNYDVHAKLQNQSMPWSRMNRYPYDAGDLEFRVFSNELNYAEAFKEGEKGQYRGHDLLNAYNTKLITFNEKEHLLLSALYDDSIRMVDQALFEFFNTLKHKGLYEGTLIIVTADHGEKLGEHKTYGHSDIYEPEIHVPLIVKFPKGRFAGTRYPNLVSTVSIYPTVLDVLGLDAPHEMDGPSLLALLEGREKSPVYVYIGNQGVQNNEYKRASKGVRTADWKLRWRFESGETSYTLLDVHETPVEKTNRLAEHPEINKQLGEYLNPFLHTQEGWHVRYANNAPKDMASLRLKSDTAVTSALLSENGGSFIALSPGEDGFYMIKIGPGKSVHAILQAESADAPLIYEVVSSNPVSELRANANLTKTGVFGGSLFVGDAGETEPRFDAGEGASLLSFWHILDEGMRDAVPLADEEMEENLRALGYLN